MSCAQRMPAGMRGCDSPTAARRLEQSRYKTPKHPSMCLITFAWQVHPDFPLLLAANRDEFHARPSRAARFWPETPAVLAGRDLAAGGTWLGLSRQGRFAALTNYREPQAPAGQYSRGLLVSAFLQGHQSPWDYARHVHAQAAHYGGFNLLLGDSHELLIVSNRGMAPTRLSPGLYGLSNHLLDSPWPKVEKAKQALRASLDNPQTGALLSLLRDETQPPAVALPDTGVGAAMEQLLAPLFIRSPLYGTRASTVLRLGTQHADFVEQVFVHGEEGERAQFRFALEA